MPKGNWRRLAATVVAGAAVLALAGSASAATTYQVSGEQTVVDGDSFKMSGGLIGDWEMTSFTTISTSPIFRGKGTELFSGCLDVNHNGKCKGDPSGTLSFRFRYSSLWDENGSLVWGTCTHPVIGGTGGFAGAKGVIAMVDTPTGGTDFTTAYIGNITLPGAAKSRASAKYSAARAC